MKFLVFNAVVVFALFYLINGEDRFLQKLTGSSLPGIVQQAPVADPAKAVALKPVPKTPEPKSAAALAPRPEMKPEQQGVQKKSPSLISQLDDGKQQEKPAPLPPAVAKRRAEVMTRRVPRQASETFAGPRFMSKRERRQSLLSMAEDMELFSVEAASK